MQRTTLKSHESEQCNGEGGEISNKKQHKRTLTNISRYRYISSDAIVYIKTCVCRFYNRLNVPLKYKFIYQIENRFQKESTRFTLNKHTM